MTEVLRWLLFLGGFVVAIGYMRVADGVTSKWNRMSVVASLVVLGVVGWFFAARLSALVLPSGEDYSSITDDRFSFGVLIGLFAYILSARRR